MEVRQHQVETEVRGNAATEAVTGKDGEDNKTKHRLFDRTLEELSKEGQCLDRPLGSTGIT